MDRRTILAVFLSITVYYAWLLTQGPPPQAAQEPMTAEQQAEPEPEPEPVVVKPPPAPSVHPVRELSFSACGAEGQWTTAGGHLRDLRLPEHEAPYDIQPLYSWLFGKVTGSSEGPWLPYGEDPGPVEVLTPTAMGLGTGSGPWGGASPSMEVLSESADGVELRGQTADGLVVTQTFRRAAGDPCLVDMEVTWHNSTSSRFAGDIWLGMHDGLPEAPSGLLAGYMSTKQALAHVDGDLLYGTVSDGEEPDLQEGPVSWFGLSDRYFGLIALPSEGSRGELSFSHRVSTDGEMQHGAHYAVNVSLDGGASHTESFRLYVGALDLDVLGVIDEDLRSAVDLGWFAVFAHPLLWMLKFFHAALGTWGMSIVMLTLLVKLLFFPLTQKAFKSGQAMQAIQPELQAIREEFKDNQEELNKRMMALFKDHGVNPLGGCLPMLIQFPVWIALYRVLLSSVELYHTEFLYLQDLSSVDPYCILPTVVVVLMLIQQRFTPTGNMDPTQARIMKMMPLMFGFFFFTFPSGLVVYIFINMSLSILQQWFIKRTYSSPVPAAA